MKLINIIPFSLCLLLNLASLADSVQSTKTQKTISTNEPIIRLWPIQNVGGEANRLKQTYRDYRGKIHLCEVKDPHLIVYPAKTDKPATALIYNPGGAYMILDLPSRQKTQQWNDLGITVFVHKYTIPDQAEQAEQAFQDLQRAIRLVRFQAKKWHINPNKIGLFGNSAGGHLAARLSQNTSKNIYPPLDQADKQSCEPNFLILQCAAYFHGRPLGKEFDTQTFPFKSKVAPTFLTYSKDDKFYPGGLDYKNNMLALGLPIQFTTFETGGHGMRNCDWFSEAVKWLKSQKIIQ